MTKLFALLFALAPISLAAAGQPFTFGGEYDMTPVKAPFGKAQ